MIAFKSKTFCAKSVLISIVCKDWCRIISHRLNSHVTPTGTVWRSLRSNSCHECRPRPIIGYCRLRDKPFMDLKLFSFGNRTQNFSTHCHSYGPNFCHMHVPVKELSLNSCWSNKIRPSCKSKPSQLPIGLLEFLKNRLSFCSHAGKDIEHINPDQKNNSHVLADISVTELDPRSNDIGSKHRSRPISKKDYLYFHASCTAKTVKEVALSFELVRNYLSEEEENVLVNEVEPHLKRLQYEFDHWDDAIHGFREVERGRWGKSASPIISRMKKYAFPDEKDTITQVHILDLAKTGVIKPHVDSVRFCGNIISGLCLLSDAVMRLVHVDNKDQVVDVMLPRRALYIMRDIARYNYTHEVLGEKESFFSSVAVPRDRRISVMCRNNPKEGHE